MATTEVVILSRSVVRPSSPPIQEQGEGQHHIIHLTPWDLRFLTIEYIQKGILLPKPQHETVIPNLVSSLSHALNHFFPFAGRLATVKHDTTPPTISISMDCNNKGAEFIHAASTHITISDILTPVFIPHILRSFFPLNGAIGLDGHSIPLLAVQVTELADGIFIGCSLNHAVADGFPFWQFINSWSEISRTGAHTISHPLVTDRWFLESCPPPIRLPYNDHRDLIKSFKPQPPLEECAFHFSAESIRKLKAAANAEMSEEPISSLQALLAHVWRSVTRARNLDPNQETGYSLVIGKRSRLEPPLPQGYLGNALVVPEPVKIRAGEVLDRSLGWVAWKLNRIAAAWTDGVIRDWLNAWSENPSFSCLNGFLPCDLLTGSSPRYDVYGNDFGWGRPVAVRSGWANKFDGKVTVFPGPEKGSMCLEVCLSPEALRILVEDQEFIQASCL